MHRHGEEHRAFCAVHAPKPHLALPAPNFDRIVRQSHGEVAPFLGGGGGSGSGGVGGCSDVRLTLSGPAK